MPPEPRSELRSRLRLERDAFVASPAHVDATSALAAALRQALLPIEPGCLGVYCPLRSEFNAAAALAADAAFAKTALALPYARREPRSLEFRRWDGAPPAVVDECGIAASDGAMVVPDVVVVPCIGFTGGRAPARLRRRLLRPLAGRASARGRDRRRLVGRAEIDLATFSARPHDVPLTFVVTELGVR